MFANRSIARRGGGHHSRGIVVALATALLVLALTTTATSQPVCTITWHGGAVGSWHEAANWSPERLPEEKDDVCIPTAVAVGVSQNAGSVLTLQSQGTLSIISGGELRLTGALVNDGTVEVAAGILQASSYTQSDKGALDVHVGGLEAGRGVTQLNLEGTAALAGTLQITTESGFKPKAGQSFRIINASSRTGEFGSIEETGGGIAEGPRYRVQYDETGAEVVAKAPPTAITTSLSGGGQSGASITVKEGAAVTGAATLSGANAATATGKVTYKVYSDNKCEQEVASAGTVTVSGELVPASEAKTLKPAGTYYWQASYSGDANNGPSSSACGDEQLTVTEEPRPTPTTPSPPEPATPPTPEPTTPSTPEPATPSTPTPITPSTPKPTVTKTVGVAPHWYRNGRLIKEGDVEHVTASGALTFRLLGGKVAVTCKLSDKGTVTNPIGGAPGTAELAEFVLLDCAGKLSPCPSGSKIEIIVHKLAWPARLIAGPPIRDVIEGMELEVRCGNGAVLDTYTGTLTPTVGNGLLRFDAESGELEDAADRTATVTGRDRLAGSNGDEITTKIHRPTKWDIRARHIPGSCPGADLRPAEENLGSIRAATLCLVNRERAAAGERPLARNGRLEWAAQSHTQAMALGDYFGHVGARGDTPLSRTRAAGYIYNSESGYEVGENIGWGTQWLATPRAIVAAWMASPGHRANILDARFRDTAVGVSANPPTNLARGQAGAIYTQDFGGWF